MSPSDFEERYLDVLQNIESGIVSVYRNHPEMTDYEAQKAVEALIREYQAETTNRPVPAVAMNPLAQETYHSVKAMCEWRLGRVQIAKEEKKSFFKRPAKKSVEIPIEPKTVEEIVLCLKRVRKSIELWNRRSGRQGYLDFVSGFV
ncbi:MAG: hypothetical protein AB1846_01520 [Chloroflexota bacterium]